MRGYFFTITSKLFVLSFIFLSACNYHTLKKNNAQNGNSGGFISESAIIDFNLIQSSVLSNCMSCHSGRSQPDLNTQAGVAQNINKVLTATNNNQMPPSKDGYSPLSQCQKAVLRLWADQGTPQNTGLSVGSIAECKGVRPPEPAKPISEMPLNYQTLLTKILQPKCIQCHKEKSDSDAKDILFYPYAELLSHKKLFVGATAEKTKFFRSVVRRDDDMMPPPDSKVDPLTDEEVDFIVRWINAGKPEN